MKVIILRNFIVLNLNYFIKITTFPCLAIFSIKLNEINREYKMSLIDSSKDAIGSFLPVKTEVAYAHTVAFNILPVIPT